MHRIDIGIDSGGSRTRLEARSSRGSTHTAAGDGANPRVVGIPGAVSRLSGLIEETVGGEISGAHVCLCAGIAGASTPDVQEAISTGLAPVLEKAARQAIKITDDGTTSFEAAFAGGAGTLLLLGTGSNIICKTLEGRWIHSGGWGYVIGDEGSGYSIGKLGLRAVARAIDRGLETRLALKAAVDFGLDSRETFLAAIYGGSLRISDFARVVLDEASQDDIESRLLVSEAVSDLIADLAATVELAAAELPRTIRVVGGLSKSIVYMEELRAGVAVHLGEDWHIAPSEHSPVEGALWIASKMNA